MTKKKCALCGDSDEPLYPFPQLLKELGVDGHYAHPTCVRNEQIVRVEYKRKFGVPMVPPNRRL